MSAFRRILFPMTQKSLSALLNDSWQFSKQHFVVLLMGSIVFGGFTGFIQQVTNGVLVERYQTLIHVSPQRLQELGERIQLGDELAAQELLTEMIGTNGTVPNNQEEAMQVMGKRFEAMFIAILPALFWSFVAITLLQVLLCGYMFLVPLFSIKSTGEAMKHTVATFFPFFGLSIWLFLASFIWIPFLGLLYATYYLPRALFAPMFLLGERQGVRESVRSSFVITKGQWNRVTWLTSICVLLTMLIGLIASGILQGIGLLPIFLGSIVGALLMGYNIVFVVLLGRSLIQRAR